MYRLLVHNDALHDFEAIWEDDPEAAARLAVMLQEIKGSQVLLDSLTDQGFGGPDTVGFNVSRWQEFWRRGENLWRLKVWTLAERLLSYRVIYAYTPVKRQYYVLGIVHRSFGYERDHLFTKRILAAYKDVCDV